MELLYSIKSTLFCVLLSTFLQQVVIADQWTHLEPGKVQQNLQIRLTKEQNTNTYFAAFVHSSYNATALTIKLHCDGHSKYDYSAQFVLRTSPCDREFPEALAEPTGNNEDGGILGVYFRYPTKENKVLVPFQPEEYKQLYYFKSNEIRDKCGSTHILEPNPNKMKAYQVESIMKGVQTSSGEDVKKRERRAASSSGGQVVNNSNGASPTTEHPAVILPADSIYLLIVQVSVSGKTDEKAHNFTVEVEWKGPHGYLSAIDWPLLPFYGIMCGVYGIFALIWLCVSACQWKDLLRIQFWIGGVIILGMLEKAVFYADYQTLNANGNSVQGAIQTAEIISCLKRTLARMLIIIVSVGFGVVKPRLGATLHRVVGVGFVYFILSSIEAINRTSNRQNEGHKQKQLAGLPLTLLEVAIFWWIFSSLVNTMRALRLRRNEVKLSLYRHFTNTLIFAVIASVVFMSWSLYMHTFTSCLKDWTELWVDTAFWHVLFSVILSVIMILWRPTNNNQRYAFTPLLDAAEDEDDEEDTIFSEAFTTSEQMKMRGIQSTTKAEKRGENKRETSLEDELKWVEEHIPSSLADKALPALVDSEEEEAAARLEMSKIQ